MEALLWFVAVQGVLGAFDMFYHHEFKEKLPWRKTAHREMLLHGARNFFYAVVFFSFGWVAWQGAFAWVFAAIIFTEVLITLWDFVEEDRTRKLPETERVTHAVLTLNYGAIIALFVPILLGWQQQHTGFAMMDFGFLSWLITIYALGVFIWAIRDVARGIKLSRAVPQAEAALPTLEKPNQRILVTGGTGFIGKRLCQHLINEGHRVTVLTRSISKAAQHFRGRVTLIDTLEQLQNDEHFDAVINLAGEKVAQRWTARTQGKMYQSRLAMAKALHGLLQRLHSKPEVFLQASAIGYYGIHDTMEFTEYTPQHTDGSFAQQICTDLEAEVKAIANLGIRVCNLRIGLVVEKDGGAISELLFPFDCGAGGPIGHGKQWWSWVHRDDVVGLTLHLINTRTAQGVFNATAPEPVSNKAFTKALGKAMKRPAVMPMPAFVVKLLFGQMGEDVMLHGQKVLPKRTLESGYRFLYPHIDNAFGAIFR